MAPSHSSAGDSSLSSSFRSSRSSSSSSSASSEPTPDKAPSTTTTTTKAAPLAVVALSDSESHSGDGYEPKPVAKNEVTPPVEKKKVKSNHKSAAVAAAPPAAAVAELSENSSKGKGNSKAATKVASGDIPNPSATSSSKVVTESSSPAPVASEPKVKIKRSTSELLGRPSTDVKPKVKQTPNMSRRRERARKQRLLRARDRDDQQFEDADALAAEPTTLESQRVEFEKLRVKWSKKMDGKKLRDVASLKAFVKDKQPAGKNSLKVRRTLKAHDNKVSSIAWCKGNPRLMSSVGLDGLLIVWDVPTSNKRDAKICRTEGLMSTALSPSGNLGAVGGLHDCIDVYNFEDRLRKRPGTLHGHNAMIGGLTFLSETQIVSGSSDYTAKLWDVTKPDCLTTFAGHDGDVLAVAAHPTKDSKFLTGSADGTVALWDTRSKSASPVQLFARIEQDGSEDREERGGHISEVTSVCWFPDGNAFVSGSSDTTVRMFDLRANRELAVFSTRGLGSEQNGVSVTSVAVSASGGYVFGGTIAGVVRSWDTLQGKPTVDLLHGENTVVSAIAVSPDGNGLATAGFDGFVKVWA